MTYQSTITQKGQLTIPKTIRDALHLSRARKVFIRLEKNGTSARISPTPDFLEVAKRIRVKKRINPIKAREALESSYGRL